MQNNPVKEFVKALNAEKIGMRAISNVEGLLGKYRKYNLEPRVFSSVIEVEVWDLVMNNAEIRKHDLELPTGSRSFFDIMVGKWPTNLKVSLSKPHQSDDLNAQGPLVWTFSGDLAFSEEEKDINSEFFHQLDSLAKNAIQQKLDKDFSYVVLDKTTGKFGLATLRTLQKITVNKKNFLQAPWSKNIDKPIARTTEEFYTWILPYIEDYKDRVSQ